MRKLRITIGKKSYEVTVEDLTEPTAAPSSASPSTSTSHAAPVTPPVTPPPASSASRPTLPVAAGSVTSPMAGVIKSVLVSVGDSVKEHEPLVILEAMKMENQITAPVAGEVKSVDVSEGESVAEGHVLVVLE